MQDRHLLAAVFNGTAGSGGRTRKTRRRRCSQRRSTSYYAPSRKTVDHCFSLHPVTAPTMSVNYTLANKRGAVVLEFKLPQTPQIAARGSACTTNLAYRHAASWELNPVERTPVYSCHTCKPYMKTIKFADRESTCRLNFDCVHAASWELNPVERTPVYSWRACKAYNA